MRRMTKRRAIRGKRGQLAELVREAEKGPPIELTRNGHAVAVLVSADDFQRLWNGEQLPEEQAEKKQSFWELYQEFLKKYPIEEYGYDPSDFENLRDPTPGREVDH
jgi:prevent-host-death family protein